MKEIGSTVGLLLSVALLTVGCGGHETVASPDSLSEQPTTVRIGVTSTETHHWDHVRQTLLQENIIVELVEFTDWVTPNTSLVFGDIDLNHFQNHTFLANFNQQNNENLVAIGETTFMPLGIHSLRHTRLDQVTTGFTVAIANDPTNGARGLRLLETAGLIQLDPDADQLVFVSDVIYNPFSLNFVELEAQQLPIALPDVDFAVINAIIAWEAGLNPHQEAVFIEPVTADSTAFNVALVATGERANEPALQAVVRHFQTDEVARIILEIFDGTHVPVW